MKLTEIDSTTSLAGNNRTDVSRLQLSDENELRTFLAGPGIQPVDTALSCIEKLSHFPNGQTEVWLRDAESPIRLRNDTSDFAVFRQVLLEKQYDLPGVAEAEFLIDTGANIGLASLFFLLNNPRVQILAVEPDIQNFEIAQVNLQPFRNRCRLLHGAVWSKKGTLAISRGTFRDGRHWATQTIPELSACSERVRAYTMDELWEASKFPQIDLLKMDVEGAELPVFRDGGTQFLLKTRCCAVECHDLQCLKAFKDCINSYGFRTRQFGELHVAER